MVSKRKNNAEDETETKKQKVENIAKEEPEMVDLEDTTPVTENKAQSDGKEDGESEEAGITHFTFDGVQYQFKERASVIEEKEGKIEFRVVNNDNTKENMMVLTGLKNIFQKQLPKMPKEYICLLYTSRCV